MSAPDFIEPVIGFRYWRLRGSELWSLRGHERWARGVRTASCPVESHQAPQPGCSCGLYAWHEPPPRSGATGDLVAGAVALWGRIEVHAHGLRAEHAMVVALALPFSRGAKRRRLLAAADALEVPAVPARRLKAAALEHGAQIPKALRPPDLTPNKRAAPGDPDPARLYAVADRLNQPR